MLENGLITFDLLWALWKPNTLAYTTTYGSHDEPRVFKVEVAEKHHSLMKGDYYYIEGKVRYRSTEKENYYSPTNLCLSICASTSSMMGSSSALEAWPKR
jgi:single-stranded DNA-binding protein